MLQAVWWHPSLIHKKQNKKNQKWLHAHRQKQKVTTAPGLNISCAFANCATAIQLFPAITKMSAIMVSQPRPVTNYNRLQLMLGFFANAQAWLQKKHSIKDWNICSFTMPIKGAANVLNKCTWSLVDKTVVITTVAQVITGTNVFCRQH